MEFFLEENEYLAAPGRTRDDNIHLQDFQNIFGDAVGHARDQARDEVARNVKTNLFQDADYDSNAISIGGKTAYQNRMRDYNKSEVEEHMKDLVIRGRHYAVYDIGVTRSRQQLISRESFIKCMFEEGLVDQMEGGKIF